jgi:hypothetical protein
MHVNWGLLEGKGLAREEVRLAYSCSSPLGINATCTAGRHPNTTWTYASSYNDTFLPITPEHDRCVTIEI